MRYKNENIIVIKFITDNQFAIKLAINSINHSYIKHIQNKYYFIGQLIIEIKELKIIYINIKDIIANDLIKSLPV